MPATSGDWSIASLANSPALPTHFGTKGVTRTAEYSAALPLERGESAVQLRVTRSESSVSSVAQRLEVLLHQ